MGVSRHRGPLIQPQTRFNPFYGSPQIATPNVFKPEGMTKCRASAGAASAGAASAGAASAAGTFRASLLELGPRRALIWEVFV